MRTLTIDIETFSPVHLGKSGVYKYVEHPDFKVLLFAYSIDGGSVKLIDLAGGEKLPESVQLALLDEQVIKHAYNAQFERVCLSAMLGVRLPADSWRCDMVHAAYLGLPLSLEACGKALKLDVQKDRRGKNLINLFCSPQTAKDGTQYIVGPFDEPDKWDEFKAYCVRDVETELAIQAKLSAFPVPESEWENYVVDQQINDTGIGVDLDFVRQAVECDAQYKTECMRELKELTGLENPNSPIQLLQWLADNGSSLDNLRKADVARELRTAAGVVKRALELRQEIAKTSTKKYLAMLNATCADGRARGLIQFYGANRTGRYAGRLIQVQNLPRNYLPDLAEARDLVKVGEFGALEMLYESVPDTLSQLIRTAFIPGEGLTLYVADYSAIEARVIAWLAGESWRLRLFSGGGDIYCRSASAMFGVPVEKHGVNAHLRQKGKIAELACGYGGSVGALKAMGALDMGLAEGELQPLVDAWRKANPAIVKWWGELEQRAMYTVSTGAPCRLRNIGFSRRKGVLFIELPSGRELAYPGARIGENRFGAPAIVHMGTNAMRQWQEIETYGGKLAENITQAVARDLLAYALKSCPGGKVVMHVHDEIVAELPKGKDVLEKLCRSMCAGPAWAKGLPLDADGFATGFYKKD